MKILFVSATEFEISPLLTAFRFKNISNQYFEFLDSRFRMGILVTGPGLVFTIAQLTKFLGKDSDFDVIINVGIGGHFSSSVKNGEVFEVIQDRFADIGAEESDGSFYDIFDLGLAEKNQSPFHDGWIYASHHFDFALPKAAGVTVSSATGQSSTIDLLKKKYNPDIESMEGCGVLFVSKMYNIACTQIRCISNTVEPRNKLNWNIHLAISNLNHYILTQLLPALKIQ